jgi:regulator of RNase E activity RraA
LFTINGMPEQLEPEVAGLLQRVETATVGHFRHAGFMATRLRPLLPDRRVAGTAVTVSIAGADSALLHHAMGLVRPGDFLVVDRCGDDLHACYGGYLAVAAKACGLSGAVVDGMVTDPADIRASGVPVWCRGVSPLTTKLLANGGILNGPVSCGGIVVRPGDAVLADESGILVLSATEASDVAKKALAMQEEEAEELQRLRAGEKVPDLTGANEKIRLAMQPKS